MNTETKPYYDWHWLMIFTVSAAFVVSTIFYMSYIFNEQKTRLDHEASQQAKILNNIEEKLKSKELQIININAEIKITRDLIKDLKKISEEHFASHKE